MELVDVYNNKHERINIKKDRKKLVNGEFRLSCFVFIINDNGEILIQQRLATAKKCPNMWEVASGGVNAGETSLDGAIREVKEELGIIIDKKDLMFIGSYARINDYVEVFLLKSNILVSDLKLQEDEVQEIKWFNKEEVISRINDNYKELTDKIGCWNYLLKYFEINK